MKNAKLASDYCPLNEKEHFPVKEVVVQTQFGKITIEYPIKDNDDTKVRILDSYGEYLDYVETITFEDRASEYGTTFEHEVEVFADEARKAATIVELCNIICDQWLMAYPRSDWRKIALEINVTTLEKVVENDFVNQIGDYLILMPEC